MQEDIKNQLRLITKRIDKLSKESEITFAFNQKTARLRLLGELVREQVDSQDIKMPSRTNNSSKSA